MIFKIFGQTSLLLFLNMEQLPPVLLKGHLCVSPAYPHSHICLFYALVGKAACLWIWRKNVTFCHHLSGQTLKGWSLSRDWMMCCPQHITRRVQGGHCYCKTPQTKSSLHYAVVCSCSSEVLIQECNNCFWKVSIGRSSFSGVKHNLKKHWVTAQRREHRESRRKRLGLLSVILSLGPDLCS